MIPAFNNRPMFCSLMSKPVLMKFFFLSILLSIALDSSAQSNQAYTIVFLNSNPESPQGSKEEVDKIMQGHSEARERLAKEGKLLAAGPFDGGGGIYILKTGSIDEAKGWISTDPGIQAKRWVVDVFPYKPRHGGICPVGEKYTMTNYAFVRFDAIVSKVTAPTYPEIIRQHDNYLKEIIKTGNVVTEAIFGDRDGGILIMKGELQRELIESDPAVQQGLIEFQIKKFYTAKGAFCEE
jgi:uncharacterized protein YciI